MRMILASRSPRRLRLLRRLGIEPSVRPAEIDESVRPGELPQETVLRLAEAKARRIAGRLDPDPPAAILAADTLVVLGDRPLGKPRHAAEAREMLRALSGREHRVWTGVFLLRSDDGRFRRIAESTRVRFRRLADSTIHDYVATGESRGKAGAYAIQGRGRELVREIDGSWSNVVGLPLELLRRCLVELEIDFDRAPRE